MEFETIASQYVELLAKERGEDKFGIFKHVPNFTVEQARLKLEQCVAESKTVPIVVKGLLSGSSAQLLIGKVGLWTFGHGNKGKNIRIAVKEAHTMLENAGFRVSANHSDLFTPLVKEMSDTILARMIQVFKSIPREDLDCKRKLNAQKHKDEMMAFFRRQFRDSVQNLLKENVPMEEIQILLNEELVLVVTEA